MGAQHGPRLPVAAAQSPVAVLRRASAVAVTIVEVDRYRRGKVDEASLSAESINKTITRLWQILEVAVEYDLVARNPVRMNPRKRKLKPAKQRPVHLEGVDQIVALLDAARELDLAAKSRTAGRYALIGTLVFAGTRDAEVGHALVRDLDLARQPLRGRALQTAAGLGTVALLPVLHDILAEHKASHSGGLDDLLFPTARGGRRDEDNINKRVLKPVLERADELLADRSQHPLPRGVTPHKLRHTFASILIALGRDPRHVMDPTRAHRPEVHPARLRARHALLRAGKRPSEVSRGGP